jgi:hypothetical protein
MGRITVGLIVTCALVLLSACGGDETPADEVDINPVVDSSAVRPSTASASVTFQLTGLVLVVPPKTSGDSVRILLPNPTGHGAHAALLGFPLSKDAAVFDTLCESDPLGKKAKQANICYVNLDVWTLQPFGAGGQPATPTMQQLSAAARGLMDVTSASGGRHRVHFPHADSVVRSRLVFLAGGPGSKPCRLAPWTFIPANEHGSPTQARTDSLINVLDWEVQVASPALVFTKRTGESVTIKLPASETRILLAHVPEAERAHLPPNTVAAITDTVTVARHFDAYYDVLRAPGTNEHKIPPISARRAIPSRSTGRQAPCPVEIRTSKKSTPAFASVATYACMPASGEGGS